MDAETNKNITKSPDTNSDTNSDKNEINIKNILTVIVKIILILLLVMNLIVISLEGTRGVGYLEKVDMAFLKVSGGSMEPMLHDGQIVLAWQTDFEKVEQGDVVVFLRDGELIMHQVYEKTEEYIYTQGIANKYPDEPVSKEEYRARMITVIPLLGFVWRIYSDTVLFILWSILLIVLIFGKDIFSELFDKLFGKDVND